MSTTLAALLLTTLVGGALIANFYLLFRSWRSRAAEDRRADARPPRVPRWYREFLRHDFLDPAYGACTLRLEPGADHDWQLSVVFRAAHGASISQVADPIHDPELDRMDTALAHIGWKLVGREGDLAGGVNLRYERAEGAPVKDPPPPDPGFDTARIKAAQNGHALQRAQISTVPAGVGLWRVSVGFFPSHDQQRPRGLRRAAHGAPNFQDPRRPEGRWLARIAPDLLRHPTGHYPVLRRDQLRAEPEMSSYLATAGSCFFLPLCRLPSDSYLGQPTQI